MPPALGIDIGGTSIKAALLDGGAQQWTARSESYRRPERDVLIAALARLIAGGPAESRKPRSVGVCAPGLLAPDGRSIAVAVNVPGLAGLEFEHLLSSAGIQPVPALQTGGVGGLRIVTDAFAGAYDYSQQHGVQGRLLGISIGTGVGACVLDGGKPLIVTGSGPGHLGQIDVSGAEHPASAAPIGPDGGRGSLEAYIGLPALRARYGEQVDAALQKMTIAEAPCRALVRAIRVAHAMYRPEVVVLLGGVGIRLALVVDEIRAAVSIDLTSLARPGWTLCCGESDYHAARGAARLGVQASDE